MHDPAKDPTAKPFFVGRNRVMPVVFWLEKMDPVHARHLMKKFYGLGKVYKPNGKRECARRVRQRNALRGVV